MAFALSDWQSDDACACAQSSIAAGAAEPTEQDLKGMHHAEYVEMGGRERRDQLAIRFPEFAGKPKQVRLSQLLQAEQLLDLASRPKQTASWPLCWCVLACLLRA